VFPAKNDFVILKATMIGIFLATIMQIPVFLAATGMQVIHPGIEDADRVMIIAFMEEVPQAIGGIGLAALMAAIMSTSSTLFVIAGFGLSRDLYQNLRKDSINEKQLMRANRVAQLIIGVVAAAIAILKPAAIYWISIYAAALFGVGWLPTVIAGMEWKRMNHKASLASMILGVLSFVALTELQRYAYIELPPFLDPLMTAFLISVFSLIIVASLTKANSVEVAYFSLIKNTKPSTRTIAEFMSRSNGLASLKKEYRSVKIVMAVVLVVAAVVWGYLFWNLGM